MAGWPAGAAMPTAMVSEGRDMLDYPMMIARGQLYLKAPIVEKQAETEIKRLLQEEQ